MSSELTDDDIDRIQAGVSEAVSSGARSPDAPEDEPDLLRVIAAARVGADHADGLLQQGIAAARHAGQSWATIGGQLGVTRQAAQQRFGRADDAPVAPNQRLLKPVTAFDEMAALQKAGAEGWHSVGFGWMYHRLEKSSQRWEHRREAFPLPGTRRRLEAQGWQHIGTVYPWQYLKRPVGPLAPEPEASSSAR